MARSKKQMRSLDNAMSALENRRRNEFVELKDQFFKTGEHFRPINILNQTIKDLGESPVVKTNLFETLMSVTGGYLSRRLIIGKSDSIIKTVMGYVLQYGVTNFISKNVGSNGKD